jgi:hypothetical protein
VEFFLVVLEEEVGGSLQDYQHLVCVQRQQVDDSLMVVVSCYVELGDESDC